MSETGKATNGASLTRKMRSVEVPEDSVVVVFDHITAEKLDAVCKYQHSQEIALRGQHIIAANLQEWRNFLADKLVTARFDSLEKQINKRQSEQDSHDFRLLVAKGYEAGVAYKHIYEGGPLPALERKQAS